MAWPSALTAKMACSTPSTSVDSIPKHSRPRTVLLRWLRMYARCVKVAVAVRKVPQLKCRVASQRLLTCYLYDRECSAIYPDQNIALVQWPFDEQQSEDGNCQAKGEVACDNVEAFRERVRRLPDVLVLQSCTDQPVLPRQWHQPVLTEERESYRTQSTTPKSTDW